MPVTATPGSSNFSASVRLRVAASGWLVPTPFLVRDNFAELYGCNDHFLQIGCVRSRGAGTNSAGGEDGEGARIAVKGDGR
jgi:hypothetical protein